MPVGVLDDGVEIARSASECDGTKRPPIWVASQPTEDLEVGVGSRAIVAVEGRGQRHDQRVGHRGFGNTAQVGAVDAGLARGWQLSHLDVSDAHGAGRPARRGDRRAAQRAARQHRSPQRPDGQARDP